MHTKLESSSGANARIICEIILMQKALYLVTFCADARLFSKKKKSNFFCPWKHKKTDLKSCILMAVWIFFLCRPYCPKLLKMGNSYWKSVSRHVCSLICACNQFWFVWSWNSLIGVTSFCKGMCSFFLSNHPLGQEKTRESIFMSRPKLYCCFKPPTQKHIEGNENCSLIKSWLMILTGMPTPNWCHCFKA